MRAADGEPAGLEPFDVPAEVQYNCRVEIRASSGPSVSQPRTSAAEFARLIAPHQRQLYGIALALCRDADQAADLVQETLVHAFAAFDRFRAGSAMLPWLRQILRHLFLDSFKTGRARHEIAESELCGDGGPLLDPPADAAGDPLARLERAQLGSWLREEIAHLAPEQQQVLALCVTGELGFQEAAELTGLPVGTVASRLARARARLRERLLARAAVDGGQPATDEPDENPGPARTRDGRAEDSLPGAGSDEQTPGRVKEAAP